MEGGGGDEVYPWLRKMRIRKGKMTERGQKKRGWERENGRRKKIKKDRTCRSGLISMLQSARRVRVLPDGTGHRFCRGFCCAPSGAARWRR